MKIKKTTLFILIIGFFLVLPSIIFFASNLAFWPWNNYIFSHNINKYLEKVFPKSEKLQLKRWDYYYRLSEYEKALQNYAQLDCKSDEICKVLYHNLGNTYYRLWEYSHNNNDKISFWQKALSTYQKSLKIQDEEKTRKNYEFVLKKLNELMEEIKNQQEEKEEQEDEANNWEKQQNEQENEETNWEKEQNEQTETEKSGENSWENTSEENQNNTWEDTPQPRGPSIKIDENALQEAKPLTPEEKQAIELYIKELQEEEKSNVHLNKPRTQRDIFDILKEDFMFEDFGKNKNGW